MINIFDIDGVLADSTHRQLTKADGSLDLAHWKENNTNEKILADTPITKNIEILKTLACFGKVVLMTARVIGRADIKWIKDNVGEFEVLSRPENCTDKDYVLKTELFQQLNGENPNINKYRLFDDNIDNCNTLHKLGVDVVHIRPFTKLRTY